jgi:hypothetical protein
MAYNPPQVEVKQVQKTVSPTLIQPDLVSAVIGPAFHVETIDYTKAIYGTFAGIQKTITLSGLESGMVLDTDSVYVDLVMVTGTQTINAGSRYVVSSGITFNGSQVVLPANATWSGSNIFVGWRALRSDLALPILYESVSDAVTEFGDVSSLNPLGLAVITALNNGQAATYAFGTLIDEYSGTTASGTAIISHGLAQDSFASKEVYALAPLTYDDSGILSTYTTYVNAMSVPTEKHERIVFGAPKIAWDTPSNPAANKANTALAVSNKSAAVSDKRTFYVFPDTVFVRERRHLSTLATAYVKSLYTNGLSTTVNAYLDESFTFSPTNSVAIYRNYTVRPAAGVGEEITDTLWQALLSHVNAGNHDAFFYAFVPVPASVVLTPAVAGQVAGNAPQQPLTNLAIGGAASVKFSSDWFTESQLNTVAAGGTYILKQTKPTSAIVCRHQLSTNMSSIEQRELSITKTVDYTAKFVRGAVEHFIGRYVINPAVLSMISIAIKGAGEILKRDGILNDFTLASVAQDTVSKDTVLVSLTILPPYPVNYIKIDLIF